MRRLEILATICFLLIGAQSASAQVIWSPCGCGDQCGSGCSSCSSCQSSHCGHNGCFMRFLTQHDPDYFQSSEVRPFGSYNEHIMEVQRRNGIVAQFVFQNFDFSFSDSTGFWAISETGTQNVQKIARLWPTAPGKILVEATGRADWDNARRELAFQALVAQGLSCASDDVVIGHSHILGLVPTEPESIYGRRQQLSPFVQGYVPSASVGSGSTLSNASSASGSSGSRPRN